MTLIPDALVRTSKANQKSSGNYQEMELLGYVEIFSTYNNLNSVFNSWCGKKDFRLSYCFYFDYIMLYYYYHFFFGEKIFSRNSQMTAEKL